MRLNKFKLLVLIFSLIATFGLRAAEFYVAPTGTSSANGSINSPWDLQTALNHPSSVKPGDTIWLRGGTHRVNNHITKYTSRLAGSSSAPITVRQYAGERAIVDGNIMQSSGGWVNYWGFEILNSNTDRISSQTGPFPTDWQLTFDGKNSDYCVSGFDLQAPNVKLINMIIHDSIGGGVGVNIAAQNAEIYGVLSYNNGWQAPDRAHGHGLYGQNSVPYTKNVKESLFFQNLALGMQATGNGPSGVADNFKLEGNAFFMNSILAQKHQANILVGAYQGAAQNPSLIRNFVYDTEGTGSDSNIGYTGGTANGVVRDNVFGTSVQFSSANSGLSMSGNTFAAGTINLNQGSYPNNTYSKPTANIISVRPNQYEVGRANIVIYNYQRLGSVSVNVSGIGLNVGDQYELHNAQNFYGDVITGTYNGSAISIPTSGRTVAKPIGSNFATPPSTFPDFGVFVIMKKAGGTTTPPLTNTAPNISSIAAVTVSAGTTTGPLNFTVSDKESAAGSLTVTATSSNTTLVPNANIVLGGSGTNRTVTITPAANQTGSATISIKASDGTNTTTSSFGVTVTAVANTKPVIATIPAQTVVAGVSTPAIGFTVSDKETAASSLTLTAASSNTGIVPNANITLGGSGTNRTITLKSVTNQTGVANITVTVNDGTLTSSTTFGLTVTPNSSGGGNTNTNTNVLEKITLGFEAESGTVTAPMTVVTNTQSPTQRYLWTTTANQGTVSYTIDIPKTGTYYIWARILGTSYASDSFFVSVDGQEDVFDAAEGKNKPDWQWSQVNGRQGGAPLTLNPRPFSLAQGKHTIVIRGREVKAGVDRFIITNDKEFVPNNSITAVADTVTAFPGQANQILSVDLLRNDVTLFEDELTIKSVSTPQNGTVVLSSNAVTYSPKAGFSGTDTFSYTVGNSDGASSTAVVTVKVTAPEQVHLGLEAEAGVLTAPMVIATDSKVPTRKYLQSTTANAGTATYTIDIPKTDTYTIWCKILGTSYASDSFFVSVDGKDDVFDAAEGKNSPNFQWSHVNGRNGGAPLALSPRTFQLTQGKHTIVIRGREVMTGLDRIVITSDSAYIPADVTVVADAVSANANTAKLITSSDLLKNDIALFDDTLTITTVSAAQNGTVVLSNGSVTYTPESGFTGKDTFTYTVTDGQGGTATGTVTVTVAQPTI